MHGFALQNLKFIMCVYGIKSLIGMSSRVSNHHQIILYSRDIIHGIAIVRLCDFELTEVVEFTVSKTRETAFYNSVSDSMSFIPFIFKVQSKVKCI